MGIVFGVFKIFGWTPVKREILKTLAGCIEMCSFSSFKISVGMLFGPHALSVERSVINDLTSVGSQSYNTIDYRMGVAR